MDLVDLDPGLFRYYVRDEGPEREPYEKVVVVPQGDNPDASHHAWADARFATDIMAEHAEFFALLMPPELALTERQQAVDFSDQFAQMHRRIDAAGPPEPSEVPAFCAEVVEAMKPFIEYKANLGVAQTEGTLRSLVWPLFFDHTRHEAERWTRRLEQLGAGDSEFDRDEVASFWDNIMDEHARFVAHLLDPDEYELIDKAMSASNVFRTLRGGGPLRATAALAKEPGTVVDALTDFPETSAVLSAAEEILDFKTQTARDVTAGRIKSIIDPRLADHVRREAMKFVDELKRAQ